MCSNFDSEATYCSEVEELLKEVNDVSEKFCQKPLRRSLRLSQKCEKSHILSGNKGDIQRKRKHTQNIISSLDLQEEMQQRQPISLSQQYHQLKDKPNDNQVVINLAETNGVPLDLSKKSKVFIEETLQADLNVVNADALFESSNVSKQGKKSCFITNSELPRTDNNFGNRNNVKPPKKTTTKIEPIATRCEKDDQRPSERLQHLGEISLPVSNKKINLTKSDRFLGIKLSEQLKKSATKKYHSVTSTSSTKYFRNRNSEKEHVIFNVTNTKMNLRKTSVVNNNAKVLKLKSHSNNNMYVINTRSQKTKLYSDLNRSTTKTQSNDLQQNPKLEVVTSAEMCPKTSLDAKAIENSIKISLCNAKRKSETFAFKQACNKKSAKEFRSFTDIIDNKILDNKTEVESYEMGTECKKLKTEILSQKLSEETIHSKKSRKRNPPKIITKLARQSRSQDKFLRNKEKNMNQKTECHSKLPIVGNVSKSIQTIEHFDVSSQPKTENQIESNNLKHSYMKSFDRSKFLDKIQNAKNYNDKQSSQNNNYFQPKIFEIPPTPTATSQDLFRKLIMPDIYPPYFKEQLPHEALLTAPLDAHPRATCIITPDNTIPSELLDSSSSSPSLPESLCELLQTKDIKDILNIERPTFRLYNYHIQALALILNIRLEDLSRILEKIIHINPSVLKNIEKAVKTPFSPDKDIFPNSPAESWSNNDKVLNSQSSKQQRIFTIKKEELI